MEKTGLVSVIMPSYNRAGVLKRAIDSVLNQTYGGFELIIVDDASCDDTENLIAGFSDKRIRYIRKEKNTGANDCRNIGIMNACGDIIAFLDSDDEWFPEKLSKQLELMTEDTGVVFCNHYVCFGEHTSINDNPLKSGTNVSGQLRELLIERNVISMCTVLIRRDCFDKAGMFDLEMPRHQDYELFVRMVQKFNISYIEEPLVRLYRTADSISMNNTALFESVFLMLNKHKDFFEANSGIRKHMLLGYRGCKYSEKYEEDMETYLKLMLRMENRKFFNEALQAGNDFIVETAAKSQNLVGVIEENGEIMSVQLNAVLKMIRMGGRFAIYGNGKTARQFYRSLQTNGHLDFMGFIVSDKNREKENELGLPVIDVREVNENEKRNPVVIAAARKYRLDISRALLDNGFSNFVFYCTGN